MRSGLDASPGGSSSHLSPRAAAVRLRAASRSRSEGALLSRPAVLENTHVSAACPSVHLLPLPHVGNTVLHVCSCAIVIAWVCVADASMQCCLEGSRSQFCVCFSFLSQQPTSHGQVLSQERTLVGPQAR